MPTMIKVFKLVKFSVQLLIIISCTYATAQEHTEIHVTEVDISLVDESIMVFSVLDEPLNGPYRINNYSAGDFTTATFVDGKVHGDSKNYLQNKLIGLNKYTNGIENGESLGYDAEGNVYVRINMKDGKIHGILWHRDTGEKYYLMDKEVTKDVYEKYLTEQQKD